MEFSIRYFDPSRGSVIQERIAADSVEALRAQMASAGRVVLQLAATKTSPWSKLTRRKTFEVAWWCRELRTLLLAGMTVVEAIETLQAGDGKVSDASRSAVHDALLKSLREGRSLSQSMVAAQAFPTVLVAGVTASERTSTLPQALGDYLRYEDTLDRLRRQVISAAMYPAMVVAVGGVIALFLLLYVIPRFSKMYTGVRASVSPATEILLAFSAFLGAHTTLVAVAIGGLLVLGVWMWRSGAVGALVAQAVASFGPLERQWDHFRLAKLYQSLALMFKGGYTLDEALRVCTSLGLGPRIAGGLGLAQAEIRRGRAVSGAMRAGGLTDAVSERLLAVGERSGSFDAALQTIADRHSEAFLVFIERATRIVEPLLLLVVAAVVGGIVTMMYLPIFDIASSLQ